VVSADINLYCRPPEFTVIQPEKCLTGGLQSGHIVNLTSVQYKFNLAGSFPV